MADHKVTVKAAGDHDAAFIVAACSCGEPLAERRALTLDELAELADEHIEAAESVAKE